MRTTSLALVCLPALLGACSALPGTDDAEFRVSPYYASYKLSGSTSMQTLQGAVIVGNPTMTLEDFGYGDSEDDVGIRADIGDDFSSLRIDYLRLENRSSQIGVLPNDWGALQAADPVTLRVAMDEWRIGYVGEVYRTKMGERDREVDLRIGIGAVLAHRDLKLRAEEDTGLRRQTVDYQDGGVVYPAVRARLGYRGFYLDGEFAYSDGWNFGGDFDGVQQDLEVRLGYEVPLQDVALFAAYRWSEFELDAMEGGLRNQADLQLRGLQFGVQVRF